MSELTWLIPRSYGVVALVVVMMMQTVLTLVHWHNDWTAQRCELCHVRDLPSLHTPLVQGPVIRVVLQLKWHNEYESYELSVFSPTRANRAPPASICFTV